LTSTAGMLCSFRLSTAWTTRRMHPNMNRHPDNQPQRLLASKDGSAYRSTGEPKKRAKYLRHVEWAVIFFLSVLLVNSLQIRSGTLTLTCFPITPRENEPFVVTALVNNMDDKPHTYSVRMHADGEQVFASESRLDASSTESFTYTRGSPRLGTAVKIYAEVLNLETGARCSDVILVPPSPPELWMSFAAFSTFAMSLSSSSSSAMSSMFTMAYYMTTMGISSTPQQPVSISSFINVGLTVSMTLMGLLIFLQLTDPSYTRLGSRLMRARSRYALLVVSLLLVFLGMFLTRVMMILA